MFEFRVIARDKSARVGQLITPHGQVFTPCFMPVGSLGVVKSLTPQDLESLGVQIMLANSFHLYLRPGVNIIKKAGGLHNFCGWQRPILVDSGGFQVFSLALGRNQKEAQKEEVLNFAPQVSEEGVYFKSPFDGSSCFLSPEEVIKIETALLADIIMPLDYLVASTSEREVLRKATILTQSWFERAYKTYQEITDADKQALFGIVQGGVDKKLREESALNIMRHSPFGYAIGGLSVGEEKSQTWQILELLDRLLPKERPRYLMGVGHPYDFLKAVSLGVDLMDCVLPTRLARHRTIWVFYLKKTGDLQTDSLKKELKNSLCGELKKLPVWLSEWLLEGKNQLFFQQLDVSNASYKEAFYKPMEGCNCLACQNFTLASLHHFAKVREPLLMRLLSLHNLKILIDLEKTSRFLIQRGLFSKFLSLLFKELGL